MARDIRLTPHEAITESRRDASIVLDCAKGLTRGELARKYNLTAREIDEIIDAAVAHNERYASEQLARARMIQYERYELLYRRVEAKLQEMDEDLTLWDDRPIRAAIAVLESQAKLLGLHKKSRVAGANSEKQDWLDLATPDEVKQRCIELGITLPKSFALPPTVAGSTSRSDN